MSTLGVLSTQGDIMSSPGDVRALEFPYKFNGFLNDLPLINHGILRCTGHTHCTHDISPVY